MADVYQRFNLTQPPPATFLSRDPTGHRARFPDFQNADDLYAFVRTMSTWHHPQWSQHFYLASAAILLLMMLAFILLIIVNLHRRTWRLWRLERGAYGTLIVPHAHNGLSLCGSLYLGGVATCLFFEYANYKRYVALPHIPLWVICMFMPLALGVWWQFWGVVTAAIPRKLAKGPRGAGMSTQKGEADAQGSRLPAILINAFFLGGPAVVFLGLLVPTVMADVAFVKMRDTLWPAYQKRYAGQTELSREMFVDAQEIWDQLLRMCTLIAGALLSWAIVGSFIVLSYVFFVCRTALSLHTFLKHTEQQHQQQKERQRQERLRQEQEQEEEDRQREQQQSVPQGRPALTPWTSAPVTSTEAGRTHSTEDSSVAKEDGGGGGGGLLFSAHSPHRLSPLSIESYPEKQPLTPTTPGLPLSPTPSPWGDGPGGGSRIGSPSPLLNARSGARDTPAARNAAARNSRVETPGAPAPPPKDPRKSAQIALVHFMALSISVGLGGSALVTLAFYVGIYLYAAMEANEAETILCRALVGACIVSYCAGIILVTTVRVTFESTFATISKASSARKAAGSSSSSNNGTGTMGTTSSTSEGRRRCRPLSGSALSMSASVRNGSGSGGGGPEMLGPDPARSSLGLSHAMREIDLEAVGEDARREGGEKEDLDGEREEEEEEEEEEKVATLLPFVPLEPPSPTSPFFNILGLAQHGALVSTTAAAAAAVNVEMSPLRDSARLEMPTTEPLAVRQGRNTFTPLPSK